MTTTAAKRFAEFLSSIGVTSDRILSWEREMGFSKDSIKKFVDGRTHAIGSDRLEIIGKKYPGLNFNWLLRHNWHTDNGDDAIIKTALASLDEMEQQTGRQIDELRQLLLTLSNKETIHK